MFSTAAKILGCAAIASAAAPAHISELYDVLKAAPEPTLGVLSQGNFDSVHHLVPSQTSPVVFEDLHDLLDAVKNSSVHAGLINGLPPHDAAISTFTSTIVSPRAMFTCPESACDTLLEAIDASIVRALHDAADVDAARNNPPFEYVAVHTCRTNMVERFPFPTAQPNDRLWNATQRGSLRIASLGPYNWTNQGDYLQEGGPTGFWPDVHSVIEGHFKEQYGVGFERVYSPSSDGTMALIEDDKADVTEPYWTVDAFYKNRSRSHLFGMSCTTLGYDSTFLVRVEDQKVLLGGNATIFAAASSSSKTTVTVVVAVCSVVIVLAALFILYLRKREMRADPLWSTLPASS